MDTTDAIGGLHQTDDSIPGKSMALIGGKTVVFSNPTGNDTLSQGYGGMITGGVLSENNFTVKTTVAVVSFV